jgi:hypothetical protein
VDRRTALLFTSLLVAIVLGTAIAAILLSEPSGNVDLPPGTESMTGVVVGIDGGQSLGDVRGFVLRRPGGELVDFSLRDLRNAADFPPGHLAEHQATAQPIQVWFRVEGTERLALQLEDAPGPSS